jgi:hypothetical protein
MIAVTETHLTTQSKIVSGCVLDLRVHPPTSGLLVPLLKRARRVSPAPSVSRRHAGDALVHACVRAELLLQEPDVFLFVGQLGVQVFVGRLERIDLHPGAAPLLLQLSPHAFDVDFEVCDAPALGVALALVVVAARALGVALALVVVAARALGVALARVVFDVSALSAQLADAAGVRESAKLVSCVAS